MASIPVFLRTLALFAFAHALPCVASLAADELGTPPTAEQLEFFEKRVRPVLASRCYECHSATSKKIEAGLRLDSRDAILTGGDSGPAIIAGKPDESELLAAVRYESFEMPPSGKLPEEEIAALAEWVAMGAPWPFEADPATAAPAKPKFDLAARRAAHWSWQPIADPPAPTVRDETWPRDGADRFLLAKLDEAGLSPAPPADRATLMRRLWFDLLGLPPTPEEVEAFLADEAPDAYERIVDRALASPRFGERWGRRWLDLVRYAESRGHEFDNDAHAAYQYRDYVIRALNADVRYDQFVKEHLAGDLLATPRLDAWGVANESILGTGFYHLGEWLHSPVDVRKDEADRFDNMIDVASKTFLGLTVSCARCHDHKFDAISTKDYYSLVGFLQSSDYREAPFESLETNRVVADQLAALDRETQLALRGAVADASRNELAKVESYLLAARDVWATRTEVAELNAAAVEARFAAISADRGADPERLRAWVAALERLTTENDPCFGNWKAFCESAETPVAATPPTSTPSGRVVIDYATCGEVDWMQDGFSFGAGPTRTGDLIVAGATDAPTVSSAKHGAAVRDSAWNGLSNVAETVVIDQSRRKEAPPTGKTLRTPTFELTTGKLSFLTGGTCRAVVVVDSHRLVFGPLHGETLIDLAHEGEPRWTSHALQRYVGHRLHVEFVAKDDVPLEILKVIDGDPPAEEDLGFESLDPAKDVDEAAQAMAERFVGAAAAWERGDPTAPAGFAGRRLFEERALFIDDAERLDARLREIAASHLSRRAEIAARIVRSSRLAMSMADGSGEDDFVHIRGSVDNLGEPASRRFLEALAGPEPMTIPRGSGRLELAERFVDPANPFFARVIVNRVWHHLFGRGIVPTTDDFGALGQAPTHPELLDRLATDFLESDGTIKSLVRRMVLTSAYRMESRLDPAAEELDPGNRLWRRMPVKRLEGEAIRDALLAVSGRLDAAMHGPPVPLHLTEFMEGRGRPGANGPLDGSGRRTIYLAVRRNFLSPFLAAFDTPVPFSTMGRRNVSNVPAQALILMNDPFVVEQAHRFGQRALGERPASADERIDWMYRTAFARPPIEEERALAREFLARQAELRGVAEDDPLVWGDLAHALFNVKEFLFVP